MADLYSELGANARRVLTQSDSSGPETTWLVISNSNANWEGGESWNADAEKTTANSINYKAIVECVQQLCEIYEVVRPDYGALSIKVRLNSVPYAEGESKSDSGLNSILTAIVQSHPELGNAYQVWNGRFYGAQIRFD